MTCEEKIVQASAEPAPVVVVPPRPELWAVAYFKPSDNVWFTCGCYSEKDARERVTRDSDARFIIRIPAENAQPSAPAGESVFLSNLHHAYAQIDGTYKWPNSREGDMLRRAKYEIERLLAHNPSAPAKSEG